MLRIFKVLVCLVAALVLTGACFAQQDQSKRTETESQPQQKYYRLEFVVKELESDKVINSRVHELSIASDNRDSSQVTSIRIGSRVPFPTTGTSAGPGGSTTKQFNFFDMGVNIDCRAVKELHSGQLALYISAEITSFVISKETGTDRPPVVRTTRWTSSAVVPIRKGTTIFSSDDPSGNRKIQLELTATPIT